jgi:3-phenylpropionate/trans-cinnamate dioxygenase ferredoxin subunit
MAYVKVATTDEIAAGTCKLIEIRDKRIALLNIDGHFYAIDDECTHLGGPLSSGMLEGKEITCPWHAARFDVESGKSCGELETGDVERYPVRLLDANIEIEI